MKTKILSLLKIVLPLSFGIFLVWYVYNDLGEEERIKLFEAFKEANYLWIILSVTFGALSHLSRAYRWNFLLEPLGYKARFSNSFYSVMIGYAVNLALPRVGEATRCGVLNKYENIPFNKSFGTVLTERVFDMLILLSIMGSVLLLQFEVLEEHVMNLISGNNSEQSSVKAYILIGGGIMAVVGFWIIKKSNHPLMVKIRTLLLGFLDGLKSILKMKKPFQFIGHTLFIWIMYVLMFYLCFFSLKETSTVPIGAVFSSFVMGALSIIFVPGGIGVYPAAIQITLALYGVSDPIGLALGWIIWTSQTIMLITLGCFSMIMIPKTNKKHE